MEGMSCKAKFFEDKEVAAENEKYKGKEYNVRPRLWPSRGVAK